MSGQPPQDPSWQDQPGQQERVNQQPSADAAGATYPQQGMGGGAGYPPPPFGQGGYGELPGVPSQRGFLASLFDFGFNSFVTPTIIKVLYMLGVVVIGLAALGWVITDFGVNVVFGLVTLVIIAPIVSVLMIAFLRIALEFYMVIFRMAGDIREIRQRGGGLG